MFDRRFKLVMCSPTPDILMRLGDDAAEGRLCLSIAEQVSLEAAVELIGAVEHGRRLGGKALVFMVGAMTRSHRLFDLMQVLRRHRGIVVGSVLANEIGVSLRTLRRDIATLQEMGADISGEAGGGYARQFGASPRCDVGVMFQESVVSLG